LPQLRQHSGRRSNLLLLVRGSSIRRYRNPKYSWLTSKVARSAESNVPPTVRRGEQGAARSLPPQSTFFSHSFCLRSQTAAAAERATLRNFCIPLLPSRRRRGTSSPARRLSGALERMLGSSPFSTSNEAVGPRSTSNDAAVEPAPTSELCSDGTISQPARRGPKSANVCSARISAAAILVPDSIFTPVKQHGQYKT
jgi:hypothetical protein